MWTPKKHLRQSKVVVGWETLQYNKGPYHAVLAHARDISTVNPGFPCSKCHRFEWNNIKQKEYWTNMKGYTASAILQPQNATRSGPILSVNPCVLKGPFWALFGGVSTLDMNFGTLWDGASALLLQLLPSLAEKNILNHKTVLACTSLLHIAYYLF